MKWRNIVLLITLAVCGYGALYTLLPGLDLDAKQSYRLDRSIAIARTKALAAESGIDTSGWGEVVRQNNNIRIGFLLYKYPDTPGKNLVASSRLLVRLNNPRTGQRFSADFLPSGRLVGYQYQPHKGDNALKDLSDSNEEADDPSDKNVAPGQSVNPDVKLIAETAAKKLAGDDWPLFTPLSDDDALKTTGRYLWTATPPGLKMTIQTSVKNGKVQVMALDAIVTPEVAKQYDQSWGRRNRLIGNIANFVIWPAFFLIIIFYFTGIIRRNIPHRVTLQFLAAIFILLLTANYAGTFSEDLRFGTFIGSSKTYYWLELILPWVLVVLLVMLVSFMVYLCWAAGLAFSIREPHRKTISFELLFQGKIWTRQVLRSIFIGFAAGGAIAAAPYLVTGSRLFSNSTVIFSDLGSLVASRYPAYASIATVQLEGILIVFGFLAPLISWFLRRPMLENLLIFIVAFFAMLAERYAIGSMAPMMLTSLLETLILFTIYINADLLAVMAASVSSTLAMASVALIAQPVDSLSTSGRRGLSALGIMLVVSLVGIFKARIAKDEETTIPAHLLTTKAERERLQAEFDIARKAQQQMLPANPPRFEGIDIAATCIPSKDVGGDLYDFLKMPGGKIGIVVADVSGKGVPASLYMTLTKGLMVSVSDQISDPGEILREVNKHLFEVCRRRVFVTLFLGVLDPETMIFDYARAGHNPPVFFRKTNNDARLLTPSGIGLGLNGGRIFDASLEVASLKLQKGDSLYLYSDGITEAMNAKNEEYGEERLMDMVRRLDGFNATDMRDAIMENVRVFLGKVAPQDDQTLVVVKIG